MFEVQFACMQAKAFDGTIFCSVLFCPLQSDAQYLACGHESGFFPSCFQADFQQRKVFVSLKYLVVVTAFNQVVSYLLEYILCVLVSFSQEVMVPSDLETSPSTERNISSFLRCLPFDSLHYLFNFLLDLANTITPDVSRSSRWTTTFYYHYAALLHNQIAGGKLYSFSLLEAIDKSPESFSITMRV